jgi:hypothetical protein
MRTRLQLTRPIVLAALLLLGHSVLVAALWRVSLRNIEFGALWEHMRLTDLPVSLLLDTFCAAYSKVLDPSAQGTYHTPYFLFHLVFGGLQFSLWGWLAGTVWDRLVRRAPIQAPDQPRHDNAYK